MSLIVNLKKIKEALKKIYSNKFQKLLKNVKNPYGDGSASKKIIKVLKTTPPKYFKKNFFDLKIVK